MTHKMEQPKKRTLPSQDWVGCLRPSETVQAPAFDPSCLSALIDWKHLHALSDGNAEFEFELLQLFIEDSLRHVAGLKQAIALENFSEVAQEAHHLKGASANVGAVVIQALSNQLEQEAHQQHSTQLTYLLTNLEASLKELQDLIELKS